MTVRSMQATLDEYAGRHLAEIVPDGTDVVYDVATVMAPQQCDDEHVSMEPMVRVSLYAEVPRQPRPGSKSTVVVTAISAVMPHEYVQDGDLEPLRQVLDNLWEQTQFVGSTADLMPDLDRILGEHDR